MTHFDINLLNSHWLPVQPSSQVHVYDDGPFAVQVPYRHGEDSQGSSITIKHIKCSQHWINIERE